jgi:hypothetical protein
VYHFFIFVVCSSSCNEVIWLVTDNMADSDIVLMENDGDNVFRMLL